jgi:hypothetical protein
MEVPEKPLGGWKYGKKSGALSRSKRWRRLEADESSMDSIQVEAFRGEKGL